MWLLTYMDYAASMDSEHSEHHDSNVNLDQPLLIYSGRSFDDMMTEVMDRMHQAMAAAGHTGDPNIDFAQQMIPHHQGAIDMVRVLILFEPQDNDIRNLSSQILAVQTAEITEMQQWLATHAHHHESSESAEKELLPNTYTQAIPEIMANMHTGMARAEQNGDPAHDFITMMIPHHQGAIEMAEAYLASVDDNADLVNLSHRIITDQQLEIEIMRQWLANHYPPP